MLSLYARTAPGIIRGGPVFVLVCAICTWWVSKRLIKTGVFTLREAIYIVWRYLFSSRNFRNTIVAGVVASYAITRMSNLAVGAFRRLEPLANVHTTRHRHHIGTCSPSRRWTLLAWSITMVGVVNYLQNIVEVSP